MIAKCIGIGFIVVVVVVVVVSHIQRIGCQPEKTTLHGGQSRSWSAEQGKENKRYVHCKTPRVFCCTSSSQYRNDLEAVSR